MRCAGAGRSTGDHSSFARRALLIVQATLSVVLVAGSTMLARSLGNLENQNFGFEVAGRVLVQLNRPPADYTLEKLAALYRNLEERLNRIPGMQGSGLALYNPLTDNWGELVLVAGHPAPKPGEQAGASWDRVSANYLQNLGVKIVRGRHFSEADNETTAPVAVVNEAFVRRFFKSDEDPLEQHFGLDLPENVGTYRIVGVVRDAKFAGFALDQPARPMFYVALAQTVQYTNPIMTRLERQSHFIGGVLLVTNTPPGTLEPLVKRAVAEADPNLTITTVRTLQQQVDRSFDQQRAVASLAGLFGIVALLLAAIGLYGVTALYRVAAHQRDRDSHGARRRSGQRGRHGPARGVSARAGWSGAWLAAGDRRRPIAVSPTLRRKVLGSAGARRGRHRAGHLCVHRRDYSGGTSRVDFPNERAADRVIGDWGLGIGEQELGIGN
jgi:hypothetical protein